MTISNRQKAFLHVAKAKLGLTEAEYRSCLVHVAGVETSLDLDQHGFETLMGFFEWKGFRPLEAKGPNYGPRPGMASFAQLELIRVLWAEYCSDGGTGGGTEAGLTKWVARGWKVSSLRFLTAQAAPKVITALKSMKARAKAKAA